jgi:hypothetical protein
VDVFGFLIPVPLHTALNQVHHPSSMNRRVAFMFPRGDDVLSRPMPASTRTSFVSTCPIWQACLALFQEQKPSNWVKWEKKSTATPPVVPAPAPVAPAPAPAPAPAQAPSWEDDRVDTPHGWSFRGEKARNEGESDKDYIKRIKTNRYSREYKKLGPKKTSRSSSVSSEPPVDTDAVAPLVIDVPVLPASPKVSAYEAEVRKLVGDKLAEEVIQSLLALHAAHA